MLLLHRVAGECIFIGEEIEIHIVSTKNTGVQLSIIAPPEFKVTREDKVPTEQN
jgi:carbon storage regulator CsrA